MKAVKVLFSLGFITGFNTVAKKILIFSFLFFVFCSYAQSTSQLLNAKNVVLTIEPHICVAPRGELSCLSTIDISWKSDTNGNYCLETDSTNNNLKCWQNNNSGFYQHKLVFNKNITYFINDELTKVTLANAIMQFKSLKPHRKYQKRRSRFPWSLGSP